MMRWLVAPLLAGLVLTGSGFLDSLERTLDASARLSEASEEAPGTTREAAENVGALPEIAQLTNQQAVALDALADALEISGGRVQELNSSLEEQLAGIRRTESDLASFRPLIACVRDRLRSLTKASDGVPQRISRLAAILRGVVASQNKSIRHTKSINRKLAALGVAATAQGVEAPPPPSDDAGRIEPGTAPVGRGCPNLS